MGLKEAKDVVDAYHKSLTFAGVVGGQNTYKEPQ